MSTIPCLSIIILSVQKVVRGLWVKRAHHEIARMASKIKAYVEVQVNIQMVEYQGLSFAP